MGAACGGPGLRPAPPRMHVIFEPLPAAMATGTATAMALAMATASTSTSTSTHTPAMYLLARMPGESQGPSFAASTLAAALNKDQSMLQVAREAGTVFRDDLRDVSPPSAVVTFSHYLRASLALFDMHSPSVDCANLCAQLLASPRGSHWEGRPLYFKAVGSRIYATEARSSILEPAVPHLFAVVCPVGMSSRASVSSYK
jgi:hypothetical protein